MNTCNNRIVNRPLLCLMAVMFSFPFYGFSQTTQYQGEKEKSSGEEIIIRHRVICEGKQQLVKKYASYGPKELVKELIKKDSTFTCPGIRGTIRTSGRREVIRSLISQNRDEAFPYLIEVVKNKKPELSMLALELIQYADDQLLRTHRTLFLEKSQSKYPGERNRCFYILQRIKDEHIEKVMVKRWNDLSNKEVMKLSESGSLLIWAKLMLYGANDRELLEKSILGTLREKELIPDALRDYLRVVSSYVYHEHDIKIDEEVTEVLMKTKDLNVADAAATVLSNSRTIKARDGLIRALDLGNDSIRAFVASHLISRSDFDFVEQKALLERMLADNNPRVIQFVFNALTWKKPDAEKSAVIIKTLLNHLSESKTPNAKKVCVMMYFYANLNKEMRESMSLSDPNSVLKSIELALNSPVYDRISKERTERIFEQVYGKKEMDMSPIAFWRRQLQQ